MYCILTDGSEVLASATMIDNEMERANAAARRATDGTFLWEKGSEANVDLPKSQFYQHVKRDDLMVIM